MIIVKKNLKEFIPRVFLRRKENRALTRKEIEQKVTRGTQKAISEYRETFRILAEYDRS